MFQAVWRFIWHNKQFRKARALSNPDISPVRLTYKNQTKETLWLQRTMGVQSSLGLSGVIYYDIFDQGKTVMIVFKNGLFFEAKLIEDEIETPIIDYEFLDEETKRTHVWEIAGQLV